MAFIYAYIPESPYWLAGRGYHDRGRAVIDRLNGKIKDYDVDFHYGLLRQTVDLEQKHNRELTGGEESFWQTVKRDFHRRESAEDSYRIHASRGTTVDRSGCTFQLFQLLCPGQMRVDAVSGNEVWLTPFRFADGQLRRPLRVHLTSRHCINRHHARRGGRH
jgi:hypothetical protein